MELEQCSAVEDRVERLESSMLENSHCRPFSDTSDGAELLCCRESLVDVICP